jgi:hypothetical protein
VGRIRVAAPVLYGPGSRIFAAFEPIASILSAAQDLLFQGARWSVVPRHEPDLVRLRQALLEAAVISDPTERLLEVAAIVGEAFADVGAEPVVVGGLAAAHWSRSAIITADIDVVMVRTPQLPERLRALGFQREGRIWTLAEGDVAFEAPAERLEPGDEAESVELPSGRVLRVLSPEDMLLWRLREWMYWNAAEGFRQAVQLLVSESLDSERLERRASEEGLAIALARLRSMATEIEGGRAFEPWELREIAEEVKRSSGAHG